MFRTADGRLLDHVAVGDGPLVISIHGISAGRRSSSVASTAPVPVRRSEGAWAYPRRRSTGSHSKDSVLGPSGAYSRPTQPA